MKIIFFGSDDFAAVHLQALIRSKHTVTACVTQPDRPKGRGMKVAVAPVKDTASAARIPVFQPESLRNSGGAEQIEEIPADIYVVIAYGNFLPLRLLTAAAHGAINVHASLLPKYRGAAPINWAIINGERESGLSIMQINDHMDAGDILATQTIEINPTDTAADLRNNMMKVGPALLLETLDDITVGKTNPRPQDSASATFAPKLSREIGIIQWTKSAGELYNLMRGLAPWPGTQTSYKGKRLKIIGARVVDDDCGGHVPGTVVRVTKEGLVVATGKAGLMITHVHLENAKPMTADAFVRGHKVEAGFQFG